MGRTDVLDLGRLALGPGEARRLELEVALDPLALGGQVYEPEARALPVTLDVTRTVGGWSLRLRLSAGLHGPCVRCLEDATTEIDVDAREVDQPGGGEEMASPYLDGIELDLRGWARDAVVLELPGHIVCRKDCLGLCPVCGENLNDAGPGHEHPAEPDSRWAKLSELRFD
jgi:uncharacterized protein